VHPAHRKLAVFTVLCLFFEDVVLNVVVLLVKVDFVLPTGYDHVLLEEFYLVNELPAQV